MSSVFEDESIAPFTEPIERRRSPRGPVRGLQALLPGDETPRDVVEAGINGVFVACDDLDRFAVGDTFEVTLSRFSVSLECTVAVVRKENRARQGYALEVTSMSDEARQTFEDMRS